MDLKYRLFYAFVGTATFLYFVVKVALGYWKRRGILHEKPKKPWGHLKGVGRKRHVSEVLKTLYDEYKGRAPFIGFYAWLKPMLLILDINSINYILHRDCEYFMERGIYYNLSDDPLSQNLLQMDGADWQCMSLKIKSLQWSEKMSYIVRALLKVQQTFDKSLQEKLKDSEFVYNITELVRAFNVDVISSLAFGLAGDSLRYKETQFYQMCKKYTQENNNIYKNYLAFCFPKLARIFQYRLYSTEATNYFQKLITDKLNERAYQYSEHISYDFLQIWSDSRKISADSRQSSGKLNNAEITAQAFQFIAAGLESCTATVTCCLYELALHPEIQEKARIEIRAVLKKSFNKLTEQGIKEMVYLKQVLNETLRRHSPYTFLLRLTTKNYELPNTIFMLNKGNHLIIPTAAIHNDAAFYKNPERFDPDHFNSINVQNRPPCGFLPYGLGPRSCIAQQIIQQQMLACLVTLLNRFSFKPCEETLIPLVYDNTKILKKPREDIKLLINTL